MEKESFRILLIDDDEGDVLLFQEILSDIKKYTEIGVASNLKDATVKINDSKYDLVFTDLELSDSQGFDTLLKISDVDTSVPIVVLTSLNDDEIGLMSIKHGAQDYIIKGSYDSDKILQTIRYSYSRKKNENDLRESADRFRSIAENIQDGLTIIENDEIVYVNSRMQDITGYTIDEFKLSYSGEREDESQLKDFLII